MTSSDEHQTMLDAIRTVDTKVDAVDEKLDSTQKALEYHIAEGHEAHVVRTELDEFMQTVREWIDESRSDRKALRESYQTMFSQHRIIVDLFLGEAKPTIDGGIERKGGIKEMVDEYMTGNQGFRVNVPWGKLSGVIVASISAAGIIIAAYIESGAPTP